MKQSFIHTARNAALVSAMGLFLSINSYAQGLPTATLEVNSTVGVPACTISGSSNTTSDTITFDYGSALVPGAIAAGAAPATGGINITLTCDSKSVVSFAAVDNRADTRSSAGMAKGTTAFGLGTANTAGHGPIGHWTLLVSGISVSPIPPGNSWFGVHTRPISSLGQAWPVTGSVLTDFSLDTSTQYTFTGQSVPGNWSGLQIVSANVFNFKLTPAIYFAGSTEMGGPINDVTNLDGNVTLTFYYGV